SGDAGVAPVDFVDERLRKSSLAPDEYADLHRFLQLFSPRANSIVVFSRRATKSPSRLRIRASGFKRRAKARRRLSPSDAVAGCALASSCARIFLFGYTATGCPAN